MDVSAELKQFLATVKAPDGAKPYVVVTMYSGQLRTAIIISSSFKGHLSPVRIIPSEDMARFEVFSFERWRADATAEVKTTDLTEAWQIACALLML